MEVSCRIGNRKVPAVLFLVLLTLYLAYQNLNITRPPSYDRVNRSRRLMRLVKEPPLPYDDQKSLSFLPVAPRTLPIHVIWYGNFSEAQKSIVLDFFSSFNSLPEEEKHGTFSRPPSVRSWWRPTSGSPSSPTRVQLNSEISDILYSKGRNLSTVDIQDLVLYFSQDSLRDSPSALSLLLTSPDVAIEGFCANSCASQSHVLVHRSTAADTSDSSPVLQFAWVGNSATQCAAECAWPLAEPGQHGEGTGPSLGAVLPPNGDLGMDGMIINIGGILAGAASTVPFRNGTEPFFEEDVVPVGPSSLGQRVVCGGVFGEGAHRGYPGRLWKEKVTGTGFNAVGVNERRFLLPALWDPVTHKCKIPS